MSEWKAFDRLIKNLHHATCPVLCMDFQRYLALIHGNAYRTPGNSTSYFHRDTDMQKFCIHVQNLFAVLILENVYVKVRSKGLKRQFCC